MSASCARLAGVLGRRVSGLFPRERLIPASRFYGSFLSLALYHDALPARGYIAFACFLFIAFHRCICADSAGARSGAFVERRVYERRLVAVDAGASSRAFVERGVYERR